MTNRPRLKSIVGQMPGGETPEADAHRSNPRCYGQPVEIRVPARLESLAVIRTVVAAVGTLEDLDLDAVADLRLAIDEACTRLIKSSVPDSTLVVSVEPREHDLLVSAWTRCVETDILRPGTFSWHVISSLTDNVETFHNGIDSGDPNPVFGITMTARRLEPSA